MRELERLNPGVPIDHRALTPEGLRFNVGYYGPALKGEHTLISPNDSDADEYQDIGILDGEVLYRGGWTRDGERISEAEALGKQA